MAGDGTWRSWRRKVHDILEVGGDAHPVGKLVNAFLIVLIVTNAVAFAADCARAATPSRAATFGMQSLRATAGGGEVPAEWAAELATASAAP